MKLPILMLFCLLAVAQASEYQGYGISFQVPDGWYVAQNNTTGTANDTKIVLTDNESAIRFDIVTMSQLPVLRETSGEGGPLQFMVLNYYESKVLNLDHDMNSSASRDLRPDGAQTVTFGCSWTSDEWSLVWTKPVYGDKFIGAHAIFRGVHNTTDLSEGRSDWRYNMPREFYQVLEGFQTSFAAGGGENKSIVDRV